MARRKISAERTERIFAKHGCLFGMRGVYTTAIVVWSFLSQVLRDGKEASCQAAVARVVRYCEQAGIDSPTADTGDYCRARAKLSEAALHELSCEVAGELEASADESWLWKGKHPKLIDGFTFTMPDTPKNQAEYPQHKAQAPGVGLPIARAVAIVSLATACVMDVLHCSGTSVHFHPLAGAERVDQPRDADNRGNAHLASNDC